VPDNAVQNSFGCGNPISFAEVQTGQVVVDIGSGAGIDCFLAAEKVGPEGKVIGLDMTPAMLERARANAASAGIENVEFRKGEADAMPIEESTADWIVSNCVINLAPDKKKVFEEAYRVLRPGGRLSVSDIVASLPRFLRSKSLYASCISGALPEKNYLDAIRAAGFENVKIVNRHRYDVAQLAVLFGEERLAGRLFRWANHPWLRPMANGFLRRVASVQVMAVKPKEGLAAA
jgi:ubiquinone/menaquinone biosynthesis C-methylase UbiE